MEPWKRLPAPVRRAVVDGAIVAGLLFAAYLFLVVAPSSRTFGFDAYAYWAVDPRRPYAETAGALGAFTYSPVMALAFAPAGLLPWWQFLWLWTAVLVATAAWLGGRPLRAVVAVFAFPAVALELYHGNVHLLIAAAIALGFRWPATWAFIVLTKVTPGVGLAWFLVRREWRALAVALAVTAVLAGISFIANPEAWRSWLADSLGATAAGAPLNQFALPVPLWIRVPAALALVAWGGVTDRRWTVPVAATLALPVLWPSGLAVLAALWPVSQRRPQLEPGTPWWALRGRDGARGAA